MYFPLFTSIKPPGNAAELSYLRDCVESWRAAGFTPVAINGSSEIQALRTFDLPIEYAALSTDDKPRIAAFMSAARANGSPLAGIINCDCRIYAGPDFAVRLSSQINRALVLAWRVDIDHTGQLTLQTGGFDAFFFDVTALPVDDSGYHIAEPLWDYWFPFACEMGGARVETLAVPILTHRSHDLRSGEGTHRAAAKRLWDMLETWRRRGDMPEALLLRMECARKTKDCVSAVAELNPQLWFHQHHPQAISVMDPEAAAVETMLRLGGKAMIELQLGWQSQFNPFKRRYDEVCVSRSWRITAPLRHCLAAARALRARVAL